MLGFGFCGFSGVLSLFWVYFAGFALRLVMVGFADLFSFCLAVLTWVYLCVRLVEFGFFDCFFLRICFFVGRLFVAFWSFISYVVCMLGVLVCVFGV